MKINIINSIVIVAILAIIAIPVITFAQVAEGQNIGGVVVGAPASEGQNVGGATPASEGQNTGGATGAPASEGQNVGGATSSTAPASEGQNTGGATSGTAPASEGQNTGGATAATPSTPATPAGGNTSTGGGSGYSSGGGSSIVLPVLTSVAQCQYITSFMKMGSNNAVTEVYKLQLFLKNTEGINVSLNGIFDQSTLAAVEAFQAKYLADIMLPWGATKPSGYVYITTTKKINEIFCKKNFTLTPAQIAEIEAYRTSVRNVSNPATGEVGVGTTDSTIVGSIGTVNPATGELISSSTDETQTAAVGRVSILGKIWDFIKRIFGR